MRGLRLPALLLPALLAAGSALAQTIELEPSAALACLAPAERARPTPEYPFDAYKRGQPGRVRVALVFRGSKLAPEVEVLAREGDDSFVAAVEAAVKVYRVPCLPLGQPARLLFDFVFRPDDSKVYWNEPPADAADVERKRLLACSVQIGGDRPINYPAAALRKEIQGRVYAKLRFVAPDKAPEFELYHRDEAAPLARAVRDWLNDKRLPCLQAEPLPATVVFIFKFEERRGKTDEYGFKPLTLVELLRASKDLERLSLTLDTTTMGCPFDLKFTYLRPQLPNRVGQVSGYDPARAPLIEWLSWVELKLNDRALDSVFADTADLAVPCIKLQLNPQEKTS
jgi:hypothetical protein